MTKDEVKAAIDNNYRDDIQRCKNEIFGLVRECLAVGVSHFSISRIKGYKEIVLTMAIKELEDRFTFKRIDGSGWECYIV